MWSTRSRHPRMLLPARHASSRRTLATRPDSKYAGLAGKYARRQTMHAYSRYSKSGVRKVGMGYSQSRSWAPRQYSCGVPVSHAFLALAEVSLTSIACYSVLVSSGSTQSSDWVLPGGGWDSTAGCWDCSILVPATVACVHRTVSNTTHYTSAYFVGGCVLQD